MNKRTILFIILCVFTFLFVYTLNNIDNKVNDTDEFISESEKELIPLGFYVSNFGDKNHKIKIDILDSDKKMIFSETYELEPYNYTGVNNISYIADTYFFETTLDSKMTQTYNFTLGYYEGPVDITISNETGPGETINFGYQIE
jgi:hypothetical protein